MNWKVVYLPEAAKDLDNLSHQQQIIVKKAVKKVQENPLPQSDGGYGKPLGHKHGLNLTNLLKIKIRGEGIRIVYKLVKTESQMLVIVVGVREDDEVYEIAYSRRTKHQL
ncbi:MAG: type II toxin-antitoxin system RelE/ParE family toxin [Lachnospiraceae bacterium]|nr:type II toxin-antitoxin system RelE/ParE family toxin [Lachnospiraceae bacterium]